jgi:hypothetical protein
MEDDDEDLIECNGVGAPVFTDQENRKFYSEYSARHLNVKLGDCVRVNLEEDEACQQEVAFGQVLAIYEDSNEEFFVEIRWFLKGHEIKAAHKKMLVSILLPKPGFSF